MVIRGLDAILARTIGATVEHAVHLNAMTDDLAATMHAARRKRMDGALEAIEDMRRAVQPDLETFIIFVSAHFAFVRVPISSK